MYDMIEMMVFTFFLGVGSVWFLQKLHILLFYMIWERGWQKLFSSFYIFLGGNGPNA